MGKKKADFGQLIWRPGEQRWFARVRLFDPKLGRKRRQMIDMNTPSRTLAAKRLEGMRDKDAPPPPKRLTFREAVDLAYGGWKAAGLATADERKRMLERWTFDAIGARDVSDVKPADVRGILDAVRDAGKKRQTIVNVKNAIGSVLGELWRDEVIAENPVARVKLPKMRETRKERAILTDAEFAAYLAWDPPGEDDDGNAVAVRERQTMAAVSRCFGGLRAGDLHALRWEHLGAPDFLEGWAPREKTKKPQRLAVPDVLRPYVMRWWTLRGEPGAGLVFPCLTGDGAGTEAKHGVSHATRLRRDLKRVLGVQTWDAAKRRWVEKPLAEYTARELELFTETDATRPVDFHSCRRAYATSLARADVNAQTAMRLAGHSSVGVHMRYVVAAGAVLAPPAAALPRLPALPSLARAQLAAPRSVSSCGGQRALPTEPGSQPSGAIGGFATRVFSATFLGGSAWPAGAALGLQRRARGSTACKAAKFRASKARIGTSRPRRRQFRSLRRHLQPDRARIPIRSTPASHGPWMQRSQPAGLTLSRSSPESWRRVGGAAK